MEKYLSRHNNQGDIGCVGLVEGCWIRHKDAPVRHPIANLFNFLSFQFQQVNFEIAPFTIIEFYQPG